MEHPDDTVMIEQIFDAPPHDLWKAITQIEPMRQWFFAGIPSFKPEVGFQTEFTVHLKDKSFTHIWTVTEVKQEQKITYNWRYGGYPGNSFVRFELFKQGEQTKLVLTHVGVTSFPQDVPEFSFRSCFSGWSYFIKDRLTDFIHVQTLLPD